MNRVCLFFYVNGRFLVHGCDLAAAEEYGVYLIYPQSHFDVWERYYASIYSVDFDYYPRGRIVYRKADDSFLIYYDPCLEPVIRTWAERYYTGRICFSHDEHYQCHICNPNYIE